jgi:hypothetical protein
LDYAKNQKLVANVDERWVHVTLDEHQIAKFLAGLAGIGVQYTQIRIDEPDLETYFLEMSKNI